MIYGLGRLAGGMVNLSRHSNPEHPRHKLTERHDIKLRYKTFSLPCCFTGQNLKSAEYLERRLGKDGKAFRRSDVNCLGG